MVEPTSLLTFAFVKDRRVLISIALDKHPVNDTDENSNHPAFSDRPSPIGPTGSTY